MIIKLLKTGLSVKLQLISCKLDIKNNIQVFNLKMNNYVIHIIYENSILKAEFFHVFLF